jgi:hypothetical protein
LGEAAVRPDDLSVDPTPIGAGKKRDGISAVVRLSRLTVLMVALFFGGFFELEEGR